MQKDGILLSIRSKDPDSTIRLSQCYIECNEVEEYKSRSLEPAEPRRGRDGYKGGKEQMSKWNERDDFF